ncbi:ArsC/Spx/MgsR family protein [Blautia obeum]|uniref:ArsC/Spx/MgsR family protein n=1 Tax=Blautia obeum TaxID=40520 RepID=UPI003B50D7AC
MQNKDFFSGVPIEVREFLLRLLKEWYTKSGLPLKKFFNTSGMLYKEMGLKDKLKDMSEDEQLKLLSTDGMLVKRPLVIGDDFVLTGFKEKEWIEAMHV